MNQRLCATRSVLLATLLLAFGLATQAHVQAAEHPKAVHAEATGLLDDAYATLAQAKHDYDGHRVRAMKQVELALGTEGGRVSGHGNARESQGTSDAQLRAAEGLLNEAKGGMSKRGIRHVDRAIAELHVALHIK